MGVLSFGDGILDDDLNGIRVNRRFSCPGIVLELLLLGRFGEWTTIETMLGRAFIGFRIFFCLKSQQHSQQRQFHIKQPTSQISKMAKQTAINEITTGFVYICGTGKRKSASCEKGRKKRRKNKEQFLTLSL